MKDIFDEFKKAASGPGAQVGDSLRRSDAVVTSRAVVAGRRRRVAAEGAVAAVALCAVVLGGWGVTATMRGDAAPASMPTFTEDGAVTVYPPNFDGAICDQDKGAPGAYVPFGPKGAHFYGPAADELNLKVTGVLVSYGSTADVLAPGTHEFADPNAEHGDTPNVQFYASWDGDAKLSIDTTAYLVVDGWSVSLPWPSNTDLLSAQPWIDNPAPNYDQDTGRSSLAASNLTDTFCIIDVDDNFAGAFVYPGGPAQVHTVVQVRDANGVVIAQYFDAMEADRSTVTFDGLKDQPGAVTLPKVTQADKDRTAQARAAKATEQPAGAADDALVSGAADGSLEQALATKGASLYATTTGYRTRTECSARTDAVAENGSLLTVVPGAAETPPVPTTWAMSDVRAKNASIPLDEAAIPDFSDSDWYVGHEVQVFLTEPGDSNAIVGQVTGVFGWTKDNGDSAPDPSSGVFITGVGSPCDDLSNVEPGTYHAIIAVDGSPDGVAEQYGQGQQIAETWFDYVTITITP